MGCEVMVCEVSQALTSRPRYCVDLERALYPPGRAGIVDIDLIGGRRVGRVHNGVGNVDETTVTRAPLSQSSQFLLLHLCLLSQTILDLLPMSLYLRERFSTSSSRLLSPRDTRFKQRRL